MDDGNDPSHDFGGLVPVVKSLRLAVMIGALLLPLASCDVLFNGIFSSEIAQATARIDLSGSIPAADASAFELSIVEGFGREFVVLHASLPFDTTMPHVLVLSPGLTLRDAYALNFLTNDPSVPPSGTGVNGNFAMRDPSDHIIIGNVDYFPQLNDLVPTGKLSTAALQTNEWSITGEPFAGSPLVNFRIDSSNLLSYNVYLASWGSGSSTPSVSARPLAEGPQLWLRGVFADPADIDNDRAVMVFGENGSETTWFLMVPKTDLAAGVFSQPLFDTPSYARFSKDNLDSNLFFYTRQGMIAYDQGSSTLIRFTLDSPDSVNGMRVPRLKRTTKMSFSISGNYYCAWDPDTQILTRYEQWW